MGACGAFRGAHQLGEKGAAPGYRGIPVSYRFDDSADVHLGMTDLREGKTSSYPVILDGLGYYHTGHTQRRKPLGNLVDGIQQNEP